MSAPERNALLAIIYRHYPRGIRQDDPDYLAYDESKRLESVLDACVAHTGESQFRHIVPSARLPIDNDVTYVLDALHMWLPFIQALRRELPQCEVWDRTIPCHDPCFRCDVSRPHFRQGDRSMEPVVCLLSALAPVYALFIYDLERKREGEPTPLRFSHFPDRFRERESKMASLIETTFQFSRLDEKTLLLPIPDIQPYMANFPIGEAKLIHALFTPTL